MEKFDLLDIDARTMQLVCTIARTRSVSAAALEEQLSQSTASYRLDVLRKRLGDPVFLRGAHGMEPTVLGARAIDVFGTVLEELETLVSASGFDPARDTREFVIAATAQEIETVLAPLQRDFCDNGLACRMTIEAMRSRDLVRALREDWDIALFSEPPEVGVLKKTLLLRDALVTYYDPAVRDAPATLDAFCAAEHAVASLGGSARSGVDVALRRKNLRRKIGLVVSSLESLAPLMRGTPLITTIPAGLQHGLMRDFAHVACPLPFPDIPFHAVWHAARDADPANRWLRARLKAVSRR